MMAVGLPYTLCSGSVQTAPRCFVQKTGYWALGLKGAVRHQVCVMELNVNAPLMTCRKELSWEPNYWFFLIDRI